MESVFPVVYIIFVLALIVLFFISITLFMRRILLNIDNKNKKISETQEKLDRIISLLENK